MSAVYTKAQFDSLYNAAFNAVTAYVEANPGKSIDEIATATTQPYEVVYQICVNARMVVLPNTSGELHWNQKSH